MKVETKVTERVIEPEKVLTISEKEFDSIINDIVSSLMKDNEEFEPIIQLILTMETAKFANKLHKRLFKEEK